MATISSELVNIISFRVKNSEEAKAIGSAKRITNAIGKMKTKLEESSQSKSFIEKQLEKQRKIVRKLDDDLTHAKGNFNETNKALNVHLALVDKWEKELKQVSSEHNKLNTKLISKTTLLKQQKNAIDGVVNKYERLNQTLRSIDNISRQVQLKIGVPLAALSTLAIKTTMSFQELGIAFNEAFKNENIDAMTNKMEKLSKDYAIDQRKSMEMLVQLKTSGFTGDQAIDVIQKQRLIQLATNPTGNVENYVSAMAEIKRKGFADSGDVRQFGPEVEKRVRQHYGIPMYMNLDSELSKYGGKGIQTVLEQAISQTAGAHSGVLSSYKGALPGQFEEMVNSFTNFLNKLGESFAGKGLGKLFTMVSKILDYLSKPEVMSVFGTVVAVVTLIASSGVIGVIAKIAMMLPAIIPALGTVLRVGTLFIGLTNPLGLLITALTLLPGVIMLLNGTVEKNKKPVDLVDKMLAERNNPINTSHEVNINVHAAPGMTQREVDKVRDAAAGGVRDSVRDISAFYSIMGLKVE